MPNKGEGKMPSSKKIPRKRILLRFRAGKMLPKDDTLLPFEHKGVFYLYEDENGFVCHCWKDRETGLTENERMLLPGEGELTCLPGFASLRVYQLAFATESEKFYYWMQEKDKSSDELRCNIANEILNYDYKEGESNILGDRQQAFLSYLGRVQGKKLLEAQNANGRINVNHVLEIMRLLEQATKSLDAKNKTLAAGDKRTSYRSPQLSGLSCTPLQRNKRVVQKLNRSHATLDRVSKEKNAPRDKTNDESGETSSSDSEDEDENMEKPMVRKQVPEIRRDVVRYSGQIQAPKKSKPAALIRKAKKGGSLSERKTQSQGNNKGTSPKGDNFKGQGILCALETGLNLLLQTIMEDSKKNVGKSKGQHDNSEHINSLKRNLPTKEQMRKFLSGQINVRTNAPKNLKNNVNFLPERNKQNCTSSNAGGKAHFSKLIEAHLKALQATNDECRRHAKNDQGKQGSKNNLNKKISTPPTDVHENEKCTSTIPEKKKKKKELMESNFTQENRANQENGDQKPKPILVILQPRENSTGQKKICIRKLLLKDKPQNANDKEELQWSLIRRNRAEQAAFSNQEIMKNSFDKEEENQGKENEDEEEEEEEADEYDAGSHFSDDTDFREAFGTEHSFHSHYPGQYNEAGILESNKMEIIPYRNKARENILRKNIRDSRSYQAALISNAIREILLKDYSTNPEVVDGFVSPMHSKPDEKSTANIQKNKKSTARSVSEKEVGIVEKKNPNGNLRLSTQQDQQEQKKNKDKPNRKEETSRKDYPEKKRQNINKALTKDSPKGK